MTHIVDDTGPNIMAGGQDIGSTLSTLKSNERNTKKVKKQQKVINNDFVRASTLIQKQELQNSLMLFPDPTSSPMGALFRLGYDESYQNPVV